MKKSFAALAAAFLTVSMAVPAFANGSVYYLNFKPEADEAWQELAAAYTRQTGVEVKVVTAASGSYDDTLASEMNSSEAPTMFRIGNQDAVKKWGDYALPLDGTEVAAEQTTDVYNLKNENGETVSLGYCYESYGIITNKALLEEAGYSVESITNFDSLKRIADDIHARSGELGFDAFSSAGLDGSSSWRFSGHLANMPLFYQFRDNGITQQPAEITNAYLDNFKTIWDLYTTDSATWGEAVLTATAEQSESEFMNGEAVFYQNGTWEYTTLVEGGMNAEDLTMIPIYCGVAGEENAGLCSGTENCWAVNKNASEEDIQATLDFMYWVVTSDEGTTMLAEQFGATPFRNAKTPENVFLAAAQNLANAGKYTVTWAFNWTPEVETWRAGVVDALGQYTAGTGSWDAVVSAMVDGWAEQYKNEHA